MKVLFHYFKGFIHEEKYFIGTRVFELSALENDIKKQQKKLIMFSLSNRIEESSLPSDLTFHTLPMQDRRNCRKCV
jgi:hypothetical protein